LTTGLSIAELDPDLAPVRHLLLDFDGVICHLYQPQARREAASCLRKLLTAPLSGFTATVPQTDDPAAVLYLSGATDALGKALESEAASREFEAAATARPVTSAADLISSARESGRTVTVLSSSAARAVDSYLHRAGLATMTGLATARRPGKPASAAPPDLLARSARHLRAHPGTCAVISTRSEVLEAASAAWILPIRYHTEPGRPAPLSVRSLVTVTSLDRLVLWLRARPLRDNLA
jgi:beta-phosphoglucomutase-like phosphatase (HAD superfamily)